MKKIKLTWTLIVCLMLASLVFQESSFAQTRDKEAAVVKYLKFEIDKSVQWRYEHYTKPLISRIEELGYKVDEVAVDIFLSENKKKRDSYKRIVVPSQAFLFTPEMHEGMADYVKNGGLLITNSELGHIDANRNYKWDGDKEADTCYDRKSGNPLVGVYGDSSVYMTKIKVEVGCPLTEGIPAEEWTDLETKASGRRTINYSATVLITSDSIYNDKPYKNQPFLAYKHLGEGACIYIVPGIRKTSGKYIQTILKNALSKKTLNWLTVGDIL